MSWFRDQQEEEEQMAEECGLEVRAELVELYKEGTTINELRADRDACRTGGKVWRGDEREGWVWVWKECCCPSRALEVKSF